MVRAFLCLGVAVLLAAGCRLPSEREALRALPESQVYTYFELLRRCRAEATTAVEAFYVDGWRDLEDAAASLEQTARFLPRTVQVPASLKEKLPAESAALHKDAVALGDAARARDPQKASELLQHINLRVRQLRPREVAAFDEPRPDRRRPVEAVPDTPPPAPLPIDRLPIDRLPTVAPEAKDGPPPPVFPKLPGD